MINNNNFNNLHFFHNNNNLLFSSVLSPKTILWRLKFHLALEGFHTSIVWGTDNKTLDTINTF